MRIGLGFLIALAVAWLMLDYYGFGWSPKITLGHSDIGLYRRTLFWQYSTAALASIWPGFLLMMSLHYPGWLAIIDACVMFSSAYAVGYLWMRCRLVRAYVDDRATEDRLRFAASVREIDEAVERERLQMITIPGQAAWKVLLVLASLQAAGFLVGYVTIVLARNS